MSLILSTTAPLEGTADIGSGGSFYRRWIVTVGGTDTIRVAGASGGGNGGGGGAVMQGDFELSAGDRLVIVVGQRSGNGGSEGGRSTDADCHGGGGSFVALDNGDPLLVAGAGGGGWNSNGYGGVTEEAASGSF